MTADHPHRPTTQDLTVALGSWVVAATLLVAVAVLGTTESEEIPDAPSIDGALWWLTLTVVTVQALALLSRRTHPVSTLVVVAAGGAVAAALGAGAATGTTSVAVLVAAYSLVVAVRLSDAAPAVAAATALVALGELIAQVDAGATAAAAVGTAVLQGLGTLAVPVLVATVVRSQREARTAQAKQAQAVLREHAALVQVAVARERTAMARELHDIAAHHLSGIAVMTGAIGRQIDTDPEGAKGAVRQVREQSTAMLRDMRSLVGLLREEPSLAASSQESLSGIGDLVDAARGTGADVSLTVLGSPPDAEVGPLAQLAAYRTVQEALANAARHAPGARCEVVVDAHDPAVVVVSVENDPPHRPAADAAGGGYGLVGMQERAELTDARLLAGPTPDGGWRVSLSIPTQVSS